MNHFVALGLIVFLLVLSALFSCSETVFTHVKKERLSHLKKSNGVFAELAYKLLKNRESLITTILIGNNLANIFASALATGVMISLFGEYGVLISASLMTILIVLFMEIYPKIYALRHPETLSLVLAPFVRLAVIIFYPMTLVAQYIIHRGERKEVESSDLLVPLRDEIRHLIGSRKQKDLRKEEQDMLEAIFELRDVDVEDVMVHRSEIEALDLNQSKRDLLQKIFTSKHSFLPVWEQELDNIVGVISKKSVLQMIGRPENSKQVLDFNVDFRELLRDAWFIPENTSLMVQLQAFIKRKTYFCLVVDEYGTLMGIVTLGDILEEIVGQIYEDEQTEGFISQNNDGSLTVLGKVAVRDLNRRFEWELPEEEATIAGLILAETHAIPKKGSEVTTAGYNFTILSSNRSKIKQVLIKKLH